MYSRELPEVDIVSVEAKMCALLQGNQYVEGYLEGALPSYYFSFYDELDCYRFKHQVRITEIPNDIDLISKCHNYIFHFLKGQFIIRYENMLCDGATLWMISNKERDKVSRLFPMQQFEDDLVFRLCRFSLCQMRPSKQVYIHVLNGHSVD